MTNNQTVNASDDISCQLVGRCGLIRLQRPDALNALTRPMLMTWSEQMNQWSSEPVVYAIVVQAAAGRAFCAGADVRWIIAEARRDLAAARAFFRLEYGVNWQLDRFTKPYLPLINGYVMGGGVGISLYGTHRIAGPDYRFAMPETGIGLFPDVGASFVLSRLPDHLGLYLGLTGAMAGPREAMAFGLATHFIAPDHYDELIRRLADSDPVDQILADLQDEAALAAIDPAPFMAHRAMIADCFGRQSVEEVIAALEQGERTGGADGKFAADTLDSLRQRSPTSLKIAHAQQTRFRPDDLRAALMQDFRLVWRCLERPDFAEGVRAQLVDKDKAPKWSPASLTEIGDSEIDGLFAPLDGEPELDLDTSPIMAPSSGG